MVRASVCIDVKARAALRLQSIMFAFVGWLALGHHWQHNTKAEKRHSSGIRRTRPGHYLRIVATHRQQQTAQYTDIRVKASGGHIPYVIDDIHLRLSWGLALGFSLKLKVWARKQLTLASFWCIKYGADQPSFRIMMPSGTFHKLVLSTATLLNVTYCVFSEQTGFYYLLFLFWETIG